MSSQSPRIVHAAHYLQMVLNSAVTLANPLDASEKRHLPNLEPCFFI